MSQREAICGISLGGRATVPPKQHGGAFVRNPLGFAPLLAHVPVLDEELAEAVAEGVWSATFNLEVEENYDLVTFPKLYPVCAPPKEVYSFGDGIYICILTDLRGYWNEKVNVTKRYNLQLLGDPANFEPSSLTPGTSPWTWQEVVTDLAGEIPAGPTVDLLGMWPVGSPPVNLVFDGVPVGEALDRVLAMIGLVARVDTTQDPPVVTVLRITDLADPCDTEEFDNRFVQGNEGQEGDLLRWPATVRVLFETDDAGALAGAMDADRRWWYEDVDVTDDYHEGIGTVQLFGRGRAAWDADQAVPTNQAALAAEAQRVADAWMGRLEQAVTAKQYDGLLPILPHPRAQVVEYSWSQEWGCITTVRAADQYPRTAELDSLEKKEPLARFDGRLLEPSPHSGRVREGPGIQVAPAEEGGSRVSARLQHGVGRVTVTDDYAGMVTVVLQRWDGSAFDDVAGSTVDCIPLPMLGDESMSEGYSGLHPGDRVEVWWHGHYWTCQRSWEQKLQDLEDIVLDCCAELFIGSVGAAEEGDEDTVTDPAVDVADPDPEWETLRALAFTFSTGTGVPPPLDPLILGRFGNYSWDFVDIYTLVIGVHSKFSDHLPVVIDTSALGGGAVVKKAYLFISDPGSPGSGSGGPDPDYGEEFNFALYTSGGAKIGVNRNSGVYDGSGRFGAGVGHWKWQISPSEVNTTGDTEFQLRYEDDYQHDPTIYPFSMAGGPGLSPSDYINGWALGLPTIHLLVVLEP